MDARPSEEVIEPVNKKPIRGAILRCCAHAAGGQIVTPPTILMNSRRFIPAPGFGKGHPSGSNRHIDRAKNELGAACTKIGNVRDESKMDVAALSDRCLLLHHRTSRGTSGCR